MLKNELSWHGEAEIRAGLLNLWQVMTAAITICAYRLISSRQRCAMHEGAWLPHAFVKLETVFFAPGIHAEPD